MKQILRVVIITITLSTCASVVGLNGQISWSQPEARAQEQAAYHITATGNTGGNISPNGSVAVPSDSDQLFAITPDTGYFIEEILIDGQNVGATHEYSFMHVRKDHTIEARFKSLSDPGVVRVSSCSQANAALNTAQPGTFILLESGEYYNPTGMWCIVAENVNGTAEDWVTIRGLNPENPPYFIGDRGEEYGGFWDPLRNDQVAVHVGNASYIRIGNVHTDKITTNAIHVVGDSTVSNLDLKPTHHIIIEQVKVMNTGPDWGNYDSIKISSTDYFTLRNAYVEGWGDGQGSAVDLVGSQYGVVENSVFRRSDNQTGSTGISPKGGGRDVLIQNNFFLDAGLEPMQMGQDTGLQYFAPPGIGGDMGDGTVLDYEALDIEVAGNIIIGGRAPVMWMKSRGGNLHHNTIMMPISSYADRGIIKITSGGNDGLLPAHDGRIANNLFVYSYGGLRTDYQPFVRGQEANSLTFTFHGNAWYQLDEAARGRHVPDVIGWQGLPVADSAPVYQIDPELEQFSSSRDASWEFTQQDLMNLEPQKLIIRSDDSQLKDKGQQGYLHAEITSVSDGQTVTSLPFTISGIVDDETPMESLTLTIGAADPVDITSTVSNSTFSYEANDLSAGSYDVTVTASYQSWSAATEISRQAQDTLNITVADTITTVTNNTELSAALAQAGPGTIIEMAPGTYGNFGFSNKNGAEGSPIIIRAQDMNNRPLIEGGHVGLLMIDSSYITVQGLRFHGQTGNGINCGGSETANGKSHDIIFEDIDIEDAGGVGGVSDGVDGFHLGSTTNFVIRRAFIYGFNEQAIDMVRSRNGLVEDIRAIGKPGFSAGSGIQAKGSSTDVIIRRAVIIGNSTGTFHGVSMGGSSGMYVFGPDDHYEAERISFTDSVIASETSGISFNGCLDCFAERNIVIHPDYNIFYIWNHRDPQLYNTANGHLMSNTFIYRKADLYSFVSIMNDATSPETFELTGNTWICSDNNGDPCLSTAPGTSYKTALPVIETNATYLGAANGSHVVAAMAGPGGSINPSGATMIADGGSQTVTITPEVGYTVEDVFVNGLSVGAVTTHDFNNITADQIITARFSASSATPQPSTSPTPSPSPTNLPPQITTDHTIYTVMYGDTLSIPITATDPDSLTVTITAPNLNTELPGAGIQ